MNSVSVRVNKALFIVVLDVDECTLTDFDTGCVSGADNGLCQNTDGSYKCGCQSGYQGDGTVSGTGCTGANTFCNVWRHLNAIKTKRKK